MKTEHKKNSVGTRRKPRVLSEDFKKDCFAFRGKEYKEHCSALAGVKNCVGCKFYKSKARILAEQARTRRRLKLLGIIFDYSGGKMNK